MIEKGAPWALHADAAPAPAGPGVTRRVLAYTDGLMCVENTFETGAVGALHSHPHTQITYVVRGVFEFTTRELPCSPDTDTQSKAVKKKAPVPAPGSVRGEIQEWRGGVWKWNILN